MQARFQSFTSSSESRHSAARLVALRARLAALAVDGLLLPRADVFQGEYLPASEDRLAFLSGFTGSAGFAIVLADRAALFADGRYTVQARAQVDPAAFDVVALADEGPDLWLRRVVAQGTRIGYDPALFTVRGLARFERAAQEAGFSLVALPEDPVSAIWVDRPAPPATDVVDHPVEVAGEDSEAKCDRLREALASQRLDALVVSDCPAVNWLFNIRAADVSHLPILRAFALVPREGRPVLIVDPRRLASDVARRLGATVEILPPHQPPHDGVAELVARLELLARNGARVRFDEESAAVALVDALKRNGGKADLGADPVGLMKARKNPVEVAGARAAHLRDGAAMVRFLAWLDRAIEAGQPLTEIAVAVQLETCRRATGKLIDLSFDTISAAGPNAALPHYRVSEASNRRLTAGLFLIDSGGQYRDGTTDITRTVQVKRATREMREMFTRVLKGMIAVSRAVFPKGTSGAQLDAFARAPIWAAGRDFDHGTGHGVGSFLSVHEGPQRLSKLGTVALETGMILSNEPGYYREAAFGIRTENLLVVEERRIVGQERPMLGFETLTFCPIDRRLILKAMLTRDERSWLDSYHATTLDRIGPLLEDADRSWLARACAPL